MAAKYPNYTHNILRYNLENKLRQESSDTIDYIQYGKLMASALQEEIAYQCFYMAHLKDHKNIHTNSDLQFETFSINPN